ncbi:MAG: hypothetical protein ACREEI_06450 [Stellaceae bacterium]
MRIRLFYLGVGALGTLIVLGARFALASRVDFCGWRDACFYETLAQQLVQHHGFVLPFVWNYQVGDISLPNPALEYWRPGMSFILALPALFGASVTLLSAAALDTSATLLLSLSTAWLAWRTLRDPLATVLAYLLCLSLAPLWSMPLTPDSALFYAVAVAWFLALVSPERANLAVELCGVAMVGVAYLIRNDAILLGAPLAAIVLWRLIAARGSERFRDEGRRAAILCIAFVLALLPTCLVLYMAGGHVFNAATDRVMFFSNMDDFRHYGGAIDFAAWSSAGAAVLARLRLAALAATLRGVLLMCGQLATLLMLLGAWFVATRRRRVYGEPFVGPAVFFVALVGIYVLMLPVIADHAVPRSAAALLPAGAVLAVIAAREVTASARATAAVVGAAALLSTIHGVGVAHGLLAEFHGLRERYLTEASVIESGAAKGPIVAMVADPAPFSATTGIPAVPLPSNGVATTQQAIARYGVAAIVADEWHGGLALATAMHTTTVNAVPGTTDIIIDLSRAQAAGTQNGASAKP